MTELKKIVAHNIATLRIKAHLTQFELGEKLSYSDKAVSRWERGEAIPDAYVLLSMADIFGVTVDYLLHEHSEEELSEEVPEETPLEEAPAKRRLSPNQRRIALLAFFSIWTLSLLIFIITATVGYPFWLSFIYAIPVSTIVLLVLNSLWGTRWNNFILVSALCWSILLALHLSLLPLGNFWMIYLLGVAAQIIVLIAFSIRKK